MRPFLPTYACLWASPATLAAHTGRNPLGTFLPGAPGCLHCQPAGDLERATARSGFYQEPFEDLEVLSRPLGKACSQALLKYWARWLEATCRPSVCSINKLSRLVTLQRPLLDRQPGAGWLGSRLRPPASVGCVAVSCLSLPHCTPPPHQPARPARAVPQLEQVRGTEACRAPPCPAPTPTCSAGSVPMSGYQGFGGRASGVEVK